MRPDGMPIDETSASPPQAQVWIVDDSPLETELARRALEPVHRVEAFVDGAAALEHLASHPPPEVLVLDWQMPGITGIEVCQFLRSKDETSRIPILMLTMNHPTRDIVEGLSAGADDFLTKPYNMAELRARVAALIRAKRAHDRLEQAEKTVRALLRHLPEGVLTFTQEGIVTFANNETERMLGKRENDILGKHAAELLPELPWAMIVANRRTDRFGLPDVVRSGRVFAPLVRVFSSPHLNDTALSFRDVTKARQTEESRLDLYSVVAHDLRAPLSTMIMRADRLLRGKRGPLAPEVEADIALMKQRMTDLVEMVSDFLDLARIDATEVELDRTTFDLRGLVDEIVQDFGPMAESKGIGLAVEPPPAPLLVSGDRRRLSQVMSNLLSNAIKFSPTGGKVRITYAVSAAEAEVQVSDAGPGIDPAIVPKLFSRYVRAVDASHSVAGTGLGLMIVKQLVEAHGGRAGVTSTRGEGSTFSFSLPRLGHEQAQPEVLRASATAPQRTVLIVDDDEDLRDLLAAELTQRDFYVLQSEDGEAALELLLRMHKKPDIMLLDVAMPRLSGTQLLEKLGAMGIVPALPVIVVSAHAIEAKLARRVLRKPVPIGLLMQLIDTLLQQPATLS
jgi:two-component system phosphate regulon sensor histidine kinase PhoR